MIDDVPEFSAKLSFESTGVRGRGVSSAFWKSIVARVLLATGLSTVQDSALRGDVIGTFFFGGKGGGGTGMCLVRTETIGGPLKLVGEDGEDGAD